METRKCKKCGKEDVPISEYCSCEMQSDTKELRRENDLTCKKIIREFNDKNSINHPTHYNTGKIEVIEFIEDQQLGYHLGNAVKYLCRAGRKDPDKFIEDLEKAIWYIKRRIELKSETPRRPNEMNL